MKKQKQEKMVVIITGLDKKSKEFNAGRARKAIKLVNKAWLEMDNESKLEQIVILAKSLKQSI